MSRRRRRFSFWAWLFGTDRPQGPILAPRKAARAPALRERSPSPAARSPSPAARRARPATSTPGGGGGLPAADMARLEGGGFTLREAIERGLIETSASKGRGRRR